MIFSIPAMFKKNKLKKAYLVKKQGFSIMEVMLAAAVLTIGLVAVIALISSSIRNSANSRDQIIATDLMQEGLELVRNVRDNNQAQIFGGSLETGKVFEYFPNDNTACKIDKNFGYGIDKIDYDATDFSLKLNNNFYEHTSGTSTKFSRRIIIEDFNGTGRKITSIVTWNSTNPPILTTTCNIANKCVWAETILTDREI
jgi:type II secretory pathway pseudopilin PulG